MKRYRWSLLLLTLCALGLIALGTDGLTRLSADEQKAKATAAQSTETKPARKVPAGRVPPGYGKVNLSNKQKEEIYAVQEKYKEQIAELQKQIEDIRIARDAEIHAVLTAEQKADLAKVLEAAAKAQAAKKTPSE